MSIKNTVSRNALETVFLMELFGVIAIEEGDDLSSCAGFLRAEGRRSYSESDAVFHCPTDGVIGVVGGGDFFGHERSGKCKEHHQKQTENKVFSHCLFPFLSDIFSD